MNKNNYLKGEIAIYKSQKGPNLEVKLEKETVWLSLDQIALLFGRDKSVASRHIKNVFVERELSRKSVVANFATTAADGKIYHVDYYNLDVIISVGYRIKSKRGVQFRIWATNVLRKYLVQGYAVNEKRLLSQQKNFQELQQTINFIKQKSKAELLSGRGFEILSLLEEYAKSLRLLEEYDTNKLKMVKRKKSKYILSYEEVRKIIKDIKSKLQKEKQASDLFGEEYGQKFQSVLGAIYQTYGGDDLYPTIEEKAAHLLYLVIKDHPFTDGNKRIASFLFVYFLEKQGFARKESGERKIDENALFALAILIAISDPKEKETMVKIITNLLV